MSPTLNEVMVNLQRPDAQLTEGDMSFLLELEKLAAQEEIARCLSVCATQLENIEANTRYLHTK